jgi:nitroreductase
MDVDEAIRTKRAVRHFTAEPIPDADLRAILDAGRRAQSSRNSQPWTFIVIRDRATLDALAASGRYARHLAGAAAAVVFVAFGPENDFDIGQAAANMQLAAQARGIGSCIGTLSDTGRAKTILGIPAERYVEQALSFGWPAPEEAMRPPRPGGRLTLDEVVRRERWDGEPGLG